MSLMGPVSPSLAPEAGAVPSSLYFQWAATPYSARRCMVVRADLDLDGLALGPDDRRVQRLVHVELRHRDVVLEPPGQGVPPRVQRTERRVAVAHRVDEDPHRDEVVDVLEVATAHDHLLVDGVVVLGAAGDRRLDLRGLEVLAHLLADTREELLPRRRPLGHQPDDLVVHLGVEGREGQVLQLPLDGVHAEPVGQRGVDLEGLAGLALGRLDARRSARCGRCGAGRRA